MECNFVGEHWDHDTSCSDDEDVGDTESYHVPSAMRVSLFQIYNLLK